MKRTPDFRAMLEPGEFLQWQGRPKTVWHRELITPWRLLLAAAPFAWAGLDLIRFGLPENWLTWICGHGSLLLVFWFPAFFDLIDDAIRNAGSYYGITTHRVICMENGRVYSLRYDAVRAIHTWENRDGTGTILLVGAPDRPDPYRSGGSYREPVRTDETTPTGLNMPRPRHGLYYIENYSRVARFLEYNRSFPR